MLRDIPSLLLRARVISREASALATHQKLANPRHPSSSAHFSPQALRFLEKLPPPTLSEVSAKVEALDVPPLSLINRHRARFYFTVGEYSINGDFIAVMDGPVVPVVVDVLLSPLVIPPQVTEGVPGSPTIKQQQDAASR